MLQIRPASIADLSALETLERVCFADFWNAASLEVAVRDYVCLVAEWDEEIVGYLVASLVLDEAEVLRVGVVPQHRRTGLGAEILKAALDELENRGANSVFLEVRSGNEAARRLYQKADFQVVGRRKCYYPDGEDAILMKFSA